MVAACHWTFSLTLTKAKGRAAGNNRIRDEKFTISLVENLHNWSFHFQMEVQRGVSDYLTVCSAHSKYDTASPKPPPHKSSSVFIPLDFSTIVPKRTTAEGGGVIETSFNAYEVPGLVNERGIVCLDLEKRVWYESPYKVTVSHYFTSRLDRVAMGAAVVVTIPGKGNFEIMMDGPRPDFANIILHAFDQLLNRMRMQNTRSHQRKLNYHMSESDDEYDNEESDGGGGEASSSGGYLSDDINRSHRSINNGALSGHVRRTNYDNRPL